MSATSLASGAIKVPSAKSRQRQRRLPAFPVQHPCYTCKECRRRTYSRAARTKDVAGASRTPTQRRSRSDTFSCKRIGNAERRCVFFSLQLLFGEVPKLLFLALW